MPLCETFLNQDVLAFDKAQCGKSLAKSQTELKERRIANGGESKEANARNLRLRLSAPEQRRNKQADATCQ